MTGRDAAGLTVRVDGRVLSAECSAALAWACVQEDGVDSAHAEIGFWDPYQASVLAATGIGLGSGITLTAHTQDGPHEIFEGEVTGCEARAAAESAGSRTSGSGLLSVVRVEDLAHRLRRGARTLTYHEMSADQIVQKVADLAGVPTGVLDRTPVVYEFLTQPAMSDWDFLGHLARENGRDLYLREGKLHFREPARASLAPSLSSPSQNPFALRFGQNLVKVSSAATLRDQVREVTVRGWDPEGKRPLFARQAPGGSPGHESAWQARPTAVRGEPLLLTGLPRGSQSEVEDVAEVMAREVSAGLIRLRAVVHGEPRLRLRSAVSLSGLGKRFEGRYTVAAVRHEYHPESGYLTELTVGGRTGTDAAGPCGAEAALRRFHGLHPGTVVNIKDERGQGRVKLALPWLSPEYESNWARTVQLGGSRGHGVVVPEVGDEVLVGFEQGCLDRPYVLGGLYNGVDRVAPHAIDLVDGGKGTANRRSFASKEGHRLELLDAGAPGMGAALVTGDGKLRIRLDQHSTVISVLSDGTVEITAAKGIVLDAGRAPLELKGGKVTVNASEALELSGTKVDLRGGDVRLDASASMDIKGGALAKVSAALVKIN
ncbi:VgrG-related protein [Streptomyces sp. NPDC092307]|uniref:VgrG-related protein n=1 Tax=Streptomyces sp. NPDC092307 TaxID=3366013 RepID=UPI00380CF140